MQQHDSDNAVQRPPSPAGPERPIWRTPVIVRLSVEHTLSHSGSGADGFNETTGSS